MKILPVIHHISEETTFLNAEKVFKNGGDGIFLISMHGEDIELRFVTKQLKDYYKDKWIGINLLTYSPLEALKVSLNLGVNIWTDCPLSEKEDIKEIENILKENKIDFFGSFDFKYQKKDQNPIETGLYLKSLNMIPTTSGNATGKSANLDKIKEYHSFMPDLALASGLTPENISYYKDYISYGLVATGISQDFYNFDENKIKKFIENMK